jgi:hypothetical protein
MKIVKLLISAAFAFVSTLLLTNSNCTLWTSLDPRDGCMYLRTIMIMTLYFHDLFKDNIKVAEYFYCIF